MRKMQDFFHFLLQKRPCSCIIAVTAENGYRRVYTIVVTKEKDPNDTDASISKLTINNAKIKANTYFKNNNYDQAISEYTKLLEFDPENKNFMSIILTNRALCLKKQGKNMEALKMWIKLSNIIQIMLLHISEGL